MEMNVITLLKAIWAVLLSVVMTISPQGFPRVPHEEDFTLVWADEFDGETLDLTKWEGHFCNGEGAQIRRGSYWHTDLARVEGGCLHIETKYYPDGLNGNGKPGWYTCGLDTGNLFEQQYGYVECRCILPKGEGLWSAFWMLSHTMGSVGNGGTDGAEIDVFESPFYGETLSRRVTSNIHYDGYGEAHQSGNVCKPYLLFNDPYETFNTYGLEWNEKEYIFYVNGIETGRSDFGGASQVPEYLILSVEVGGENAVPEDSWAGAKLTQESAPSDFIVDYVRVYQYKTGV